MTIERNRYFTGKLLDEADLTQEQLYFREKARRHNRMLHGWGIVCGLGVRQGAAAGELAIEPGYAIDPHGDEIVVDGEVTVDLCSEDDDQRTPGRPLYLAIRYAEYATHPVPVGESVEYSRIRESFAVKLLTELPGEPWVILAEVLLDSNLEVAKVDLQSHQRRLAGTSAAGAEHAG